MLITSDYVSQVLRVYSILISKLMSDVKRVWDSVRVILQRFRDTSLHSGIHVYMLFLSLHNKFLSLHGKLIRWELTSWEVDLM